MGKRLPYWPLGVPLVGAAIELYEWYTKPGRSYKLGANWSWCKGPANAPPPPDGPGWLSEPAFIPGSCFLGVPLYGQGGWVLPPAPEWTTGVNTFRDNNEVYLTRVYGDTNGTTAHFIVDGVAQKSVWMENDPGIIAQGESAPMVPTLEPQRQWVPDPIGLNPESWVDPAPTPWRLIPDRVTNPNRPPSERREVGPGPEARALPRPSRPWKPPVVIFRPGVPPSYSNRKPKIEPPKKGEKERKPGRKIGGRILRVAGAITEWQDAMDAAYYALPRAVRNARRARRRINGDWSTPGPIERDRMVYRHWDRVDFKKFYQTLLRQQQNDRVIGEVMKRRGAAYRRLRVNPYVNEDFMGQLRGLGTLQERRAFWDNVYAQKRARKEERRHQRGLMQAERIRALGDTWNPRVKKAR